MASTFVNDLRLEEMGTGENSGTWGNKTNANLELIGEAFGMGTENLGSDANTTITIADGTADAARSIYLKITSTSLSATRTVTLAPNTVSKIWIIENAQDFYIGLDDSADDLVIGKGSTVGTTPAVEIDENLDIKFAESIGVGQAASSTTGDIVAQTMSLKGTTPSLTIGDGGAEDTKLVYDGNAKDFYMGLDDSADKLVVGVGSGVGTNSILTLDDDSVTIGDGAAVDTKIVFDGNAQDYYVGLDDSADDLLIGLGSAVGTTPAISIDENQTVTFSKNTLSATDTDTSNTGSITLDFQVNQNFVLTLTGNITLANPSTEAVGQSGVMVMIQDGTGSRTLSLGTDYETAGGSGITLSTGANAVDVIPYFVKASGSIQLGAVQKAFA